MCMYRQETPVDAHTKMNKLVSNIHVHIHIYAHICIHICIYIYVYIYIYIYMHTHMSLHITPRNVKACERGEVGMVYTDLQGERERDTSIHIYLYIHMCTHVQICHNTSPPETPRRVSEKSLVWGQVFYICCTYAHKNRDEKLVFCSSVRGCIYFFVRACAIALRSGGALGRCAREGGEVFMKM